MHPGALGDLVQAFRAFGAVRAAYPDSRLALLTDDALVAFARGTQIFDAVTGFDASIAYGGTVASRLRLAASLVVGVRRYRPDAVAVFKGSPVYAALAAASGARWRVGLARGAGRLLLTRAIAIDPSCHHEDRYSAVVAALGADPRRAVPAAWPERESLVPPDVRARAWPLVGLAPGGARNVKQDLATKRWPAARFAQLARDISVAYPNAAFVLLGGPGDRAELDEVRAALRGPDVLDLGGRTDVPGARAAIAELDVFVGNDSGLMHVAATTRTPAVIAFGPTDPRAIAPLVPSMHVVWSPARDVPCYEDAAGAHRPCVNPCCIERVHVAAMRASVDAALAAAGRARRSA
ncbi:hypothetical protein tb265_36360 [Gemmatimonadetes bacterium T265]|nr:hypothetical protein tb265_36360 [Gemmatimonadetes bacterium T265]